MGSNVSSFEFEIVIELIKCFLFIYSPQISSTAQLCLDPYYRTVDGFRILVEKEWLSFGKFVPIYIIDPWMLIMCFLGHKFADRCGHGVGSDETNERCPVFLQWIDCVHQIHRQFPCAFEFGMAYLVNYERKKF